MGLSRSTYYDVPSVPTDDAALVATMIAICDEFEAYGYRRVGAELRHYGIVVNSKSTWPTPETRANRPELTTATTTGNQRGNI
jgi:putative transposase